MRPEARYAQKEASKESKNGRRRQTEEGRVLSWWWWARCIKSGAAIWTLLYSSSCVTCTLLDQISSCRLHLWVPIYDDGADIDTLRVDRMMVIKVIKKREPEAREHFNHRQITNRAFGTWHRHQIADGLRRTGSPYSGQMDRFDCSSVRYVCVRRPDTCQAFFYRFLRRSGFPAMKPTVRLAGNGCCYGVSVLPTCCT